MRPTWGPDEVVMVEGGGPSRWARLGDSVAGRNSGTQQ